MKDQAKELIREADRKGSVLVQAGVWLCTAEDLLEEQKTWHDEDQSKNLDLTSSPYWLTTDDGQGPFPISGADDDDLLKLID